MNSEKVKALFTLAGFEVLGITLCDGYSFHPDDERFYETLPRCVWWFVKTPIGWIEFGRRKRVFNIDWSDTSVRAVVTNDDVTKSETYVHAWSEEKALEYLKALKSISKK